MANHCERSADPSRSNQFKLGNGGLPEQNLVVKPKLNTVPYIVAGPLS
jgi:hypothetical protein